MRRPVPIFVLVAVLAMASCGSSGDDSPFDFDRSDYPGIVVLPLDAYRENRPTEPGDDTGPESPIIESVRAAAETRSDFPFIVDWNTMLGLAANGMGDDRDVQRYYLAYEVTSTPSQAGCTVVVHVFEGLPFDPQRAELTRFEVTVDFGEQHRDGFTIQTPGECENEAGHRVVEAMESAGFFPEGWSRGPPAHTGG